MHVASLELCKELYELSGWENTEKVWFEFSDGIMPHTNDLKPEQFERWICRAYDLGYLLRKLQDGTVLFKQERGYAAVGRGPFPETFATDTPEDAACKLAIELFKQGILERE